MDTLWIRKKKKFRAKTGESYSELISSEETEGDFGKLGEIIRDGGTVVFPTETVYGLGADATNPEAVKKIFEAKGRPSDNPLIVHLDRPERALKLVEEFPEKAGKLAEAFWPGPLTLVLKKKPVIPDSVTGGLDTVGIRIPDNELTRKLISESDRPIAGPSANLSGAPSLTAVDDVLRELTGKVSGILTDGPSDIGIESTVINMTREPPVILRPGKISKKEIEAVIGSVERANGEAERPLSPGMKYRHYAPKAEMYLVTGKPEERAGKIEKFLTENQNVGVLILGDSLVDQKKRINNEEYINIGKTTKEISRGLYTALRDFDRMGVSVILAELLPENDENAGIYDRLLRASERKMI